MRHRQREVYHLCDESSVNNTARPTSLRYGRERGGFRVIAERYGDASVEVQEARKVEAADGAGQHHSSRPFLFIPLKQKKAGGAVQFPHIPPTRRPIAPPAA